MGRILVVNEAEMAGDAILAILDIEGHSADVVSLHDAASDISFVGGFDLLIITAGGGAEIDGVISADPIKIYF